MRRRRTTLGLALLAAACSSGTAPEPLDPVELTGQWAAVLEDGLEVQLTIWIRGELEAVAIARNAEGETSGVSSGVLIEGATITVGAGSALVVQGVYGGDTITGTVTAFGVTQEATLWRQ